MKYLKLFEGFEDIDAICQKYGITNYTINSDGSIDVDGSLNWKKLDKLPVKFNRVSRHFYCQYNQLISLEGAPKIVEGDFYCNYNQLPQLIYDNYQYIEEIIKWQDEYNIWRGGKLDEFRFSEMMIDIKEELKK